jgi:hypothetical protein
LITKYWNSKAENKSTAKELYQELEKNYDSENYSQIEEYSDKIKLNRSSEKRSSTIHKNSILVDF